MKQAVKRKKGDIPAYTDSKATARKSVEGELAHIAGLERVKSRDPVHHLIEQSRNLFDVLGRANAEKMMGDGRNSFNAVDKMSGNDKAIGSESEKTKRLGENEYDTESDTVSEGEQNSDFYKRFSEIAFTKGKLLCSVEQGGGKMMMASCIRRSIDQSPPSDARQTEVRKHGATQMGVPDNRSKLTYHRYTRGALSLVVDTAQNLTRTLQVFERMAEGDIADRLGLPEIDTAYRMYPFLTTTQEKTKLESYREELRSLDNTDSKRRTALNFGINRLNTIISHKNRMRQDFYFGLRKLLEDSRRAAELFSQPAVEDEILQDVLEGVAVGDDEDGVNNETKRKRKNRNENRTD
ncbi:MAG: hypothetical protein LBD23_18915 [Oscillospiraceae bacterium]|nr:hypothetical protein [Oscillospiraceae bacterium]